MPETSSSLEVLLELPSEFAYELMEQDLVWPYVREDRIDPALVPAVVLAVTTAASTVVATKLTDSVVASLTSAIRSWLKQREAGDPAALRASDDDTALVIDADTTDEEIAAYLRRVRGDRSEQG